MLALYQVFKDYNTYLFFFFQLLNFKTLINLLNRYKFGLLELFLV